jgi:deoxyribonuclease-4
MKGCDTVQVFTRNPRGWRIQPLDLEAAELLRSKLKKYGISPLVAHASYLPNMASPDKKLYEKSVFTLGEEVARADAMGADFFVTHVGHHKGAGVERGTKLIVKALNKIIAAQSPRLTILLENTADAGKSCGESIEQLKTIVQGVKKNEKVGICLDTCHAFAHGYNVADPRGLAALIELIEKQVGLERLKVIHLNDSAYPLGTHYDRHEHIGRGHIGERGFRVILRNPVIRNLPGILETPIEKPGDDVRNLATIRRLAA